MATFTDGEQVLQTEGNVSSAPPAIVRKITSQNLSSGNLNYTTDFAANVTVKQVLARFTADPGNQEFKVTLISKDGVSYNTLLRAADTKDVLDFSFEFNGNGILLESGDELEITCENNGSPSSIVYITVVGQEA